MLATTQMNSAMPSGHKIGPIISVRQRSDQTGHLGERGSDFDSCACIAIVP